VEISISLLLIGTEQAKLTVTRPAEPGCVQVVPHDDAAPAAVGKIVEEIVVEGMKSDL
jgi:hypothetical protein